MTFLLGVGLKLLGFGKTVLDLTLGLVKSIFKFATEKPIQFLLIMLALALVWTSWFAFTTNKELERTRQIVIDKTEFIKKQDVSIKAHVKAFEDEKKLHRHTIEANNRAVNELRLAAEAALRKAREEARKVADTRQAYLDMAEKYRVANSSKGTAEERLERERRTNEEFFRDWRNAR